MRAFRILLSENTLSISDIALNFLSLSPFKKTQMKLRTILPALLALALASCQSGRLTDYANPFMGTTTLWEAEDLGYVPKRGIRASGAETFPGASMPNAMVQVSPVTKFRSGSGYMYEGTSIYGFCHTAMGHWLLCHIPVLPASGQIDPMAYDSPFSHENESARPGYYQVYLEKYGVDVELTSTLRCAYHRYTYDSGADKKVIFDLTRSNLNVSDWTLKKESDHVLSGYQSADGKMYFYAVSDTPLGDVTQVGKLSVVPFLGKGREVDMKIGFSFVSVENAKENLEKEMLQKDFDQVAGEADEAWETLLSRIRIKGGTERQKEMFYSTLYKSFLWPALRSDCNGDYTDVKGDVVNNGFDYYTSPCFWDDHRDKLILLGMMFPDLTCDVIKSVTDMGEKRNGYMPTYFHGDHASTFISGTWQRGIQDFDLERAYKLILKNATVPGPGGRQFMNEYVEKGWISDKDTTGLPFYEEFKGGVHKVLEYSYDDYATAQVARILGDDSNYERLMEQSRNYRNVFDPSTGFYRGRVEDGSWIRDFDPDYPYLQHMWREANAWNLLFYPVHEPEAVLAQYPSHEVVEAKLDTLFTRPWCGEEVENMSGFIGQYCHGNQPGHHIPYTYYFIGKQEKCQHYLNIIMEDYYGMGEEGLAYAGMDDAGEMSAWYVLNSMGLFTYSPADPEYIVTVPLFDEVAFTLADGKVFTIRKEGEGEKIASIDLNGKKLEGWFLQDSDFKQGGTLTVSCTR